MVVRSTLAKMTAVASVVSASLVSVASGAVAQDSPFTVYGARPGTKVQLVPYRDLNLRYGNHQEVLYSRVGLAVRRVCSFDDGNIPTMDNDYRVCRNDAWSGARPQISTAIWRAYQPGYRGRVNGAIIVQDRN